MSWNLFRFMLLRPPTLTIHHLNESYFFVFWHMQLYMSWYIRSFFGFTFLNILYFFKYTCTNISHRRSLYTFYLKSLHAKNNLQYPQRLPTVCCVITDLSWQFGKNISKYHIWWMTVHSRLPLAIKKSISYMGKLRHKVIKLDFQSKNNE